MKRILMRLLALMTVLLMLMPMAQAAEFGAQETSLVIRFPYEGMTFSLYRVAERGADGSFVKTDKFARVPVDLSQAEAEDFPVLAETLAYYVQWQQIPPDATATIGAGRAVRFSSLRPGLYLVTAGTVTVNGKTYTAKPLLVELTAEQSGGGEAIYSPKPGELPPAGGDETVSRKVLKIWDDAGAEQRPAFITVHLLRDGKVVETVRLRAEDQWRWRWDDLSEDHEWTVVEEPVAGYTTEIRLEGITFVITNSRALPPGDDPTPPGGEDPPGGDDPPGGENPPDDDDPPSGDDPDPEDKTDEPKLPQTGLLWWPVPVLAGAGMMLFTAGWLSGRREDDE